MIKKVYTVSLVAFILLLSGCSKDFLKSYDKRIVGTWSIDYTNIIGLGGSASNLPFNSGTITFFENGTLEYSTAANRTFKGKWDIIRKMQGDDFVKSLQLSAVDYTRHEVLTQYYDEMNFTGTNRFKATINSNLHTYITHFSR